MPNRFLRELQAFARSPFLGRQGGRSKRLLWAKSKYSSRLGSITPNAARHFYNQLRSNLLRDIMLVEVLPSWRYRYRLIGTANAKAHGMNATGRYLDAVLPGPEYKAHVLGLYDGCVRARRPLCSECLFISLEQAPERHTKVLFLQLSNDGERVNQVLVVQVFFYIDPATRQWRFIEPRPFKEIAHVLFEVPSGVEMARR